MFRRAISLQGDLVNKALLAAGCLMVLIGVRGSHIQIGPKALAQSLQSSHYQLNESYIGPGGNVNSSSAGYSESSTIGDIGVGAASSNSYGIVEGINTTSDPRLSLIVNSSSVSFGSLSTSVPATGTATFSVLNYTAHGYTVYTVGAAPSNGSHTLHALSPATTSSPGSEQYGINLTGVNNVGTGNFGTAPLQVPSGFSFGAAATNYATTNNFRYGAGEQIAQSAQSSGETDYTISYLVNVSTSTPAGKYTGNQLLVVVGSY